MKSKLYLVLILFSLPMLAFGQIIPLTNPSFEDVPHFSKVPKGWYDCGFPGESPPDIQPDPTFRVSQAPYDGRSYLGLVVRDNDTYELVGQKLPETLKKDSCYTFSFFAARSENYVSVSRITDREANYNTPALIRVWGGFDYCDRQELFGTSELVISSEWFEIQLAFKPKKAYTHFVIQAFYKIPTLFPYNGNVLLDNVTLYKGCKAEEVKK